MILSLPRLVLHQGKHVLMPDFLAKELGGILGHYCILTGGRVQAQLYCTVLHEGELPELALTPAGQSSDQLHSQCNTEGSPVWTLHLPARWYLRNLFVDSFI